jgi:6-phosphogluconolactonase (cycloisomerase 2 family)
MSPTTDGSRKNNARTHALSFGFGAVLVLLTSAAGAFGQAATRAAFVSNDGNLEGSVTAYTFDAAGAPRFVQKVVIGTRESTAEYEPGCNAYTISITPNGRYLATGHAAGDYTYQQITILEVAPDATLTILGEYSTPTTPLDVEWISDRYLAASRTNLGGPNEVIVYQFDPNALTLTEVDRGSGGTFTSSIAVHPSREYVYAGDSGVNDIYVFHVNPDGTLAPIQTVDTGSTYPLGVKVAPDGRKLYASGGISSGSNKILGYHIAGDGTLSAMSGMPFTTPGNSPKDCAFSRDSALLFVGHGSDSTARSFLIDDETGQLTATGYLFDVGALSGELGDLVVLRDYLLITDNWYNERGLYSFDILPNGNLTMNGTLVDSQGVGPREIAVWRPPCAGDVNDDDEIDLADLGILLSSYGLCEGDPGFLPEADLDDDGCVQLSDLGVLLASYGQTCP